MNVYQEHIIFVAVSVKTLEFDYGHKLVSVGEYCRPKPDMIHYEGVVRVPIEIEKYNSMGNYENHGTHYKEFEVIKTVAGDIIWKRTA